MEPISVLVSLNEKYLPQLHVLLTSICCNNPGEKIRLYLLHGGIGAGLLEPVIRQCGAYGYDFSPFLWIRPALPARPLQSGIRRRCITAFCPVNFFPSRRSASCIWTRKSLCSIRSDACGNWTLAVRRWLPLRTRGKRNWPTT